MKSKGDNDYYKACVDELKSIIPVQEYEEIMGQYFCELDRDFLGFVNIYKSVSISIPKEMTVIDFGCYVAAQSYYFADHAGYIGVDLTKLKRFTPKNTTHYVCNIQDFIKEELPGIAHWNNIDSLFAVCSYVPDFEATRIVRETFPNVFCYYPSCMSNTPIIKIGG